jgi:toxin FitB
VTPALWDTGVVIDAMEDALPAGALDELPGVLSAISLGELAYGVALARTAAGRHARRMKLDVVRRTFTVLPFDDVAAEHYGGLAQIVREAGRSPRPRRMDLQIAATAVAHGLPLVTGNASDFRDLAGVLRIIDLGEPAT